MDPPMQPTVSDERVLIRPMAADDFDALFAVASDRLIWEVHPAHDRWQEPVFRKYFDDGLASNGAVVFIDRSNGKIIGASRYENERAPIEPGEVEIGWTFISRAYWGGEWNRSVKRLMIRHAFDTGHRAALFLVGENNIRSRRAMEKIGGTLTDRTSMALTGGVSVLHVVYEIRPDGFATGPLVLD
jgi:RimJ/RimL family protein N-acetyltransferase